ncbi:MAG: hypothetical protein ACKOB4_19210, partial [Acidobacteriota bacterium]
ERKREGEKEGKREGKRRGRKKGGGREGREGEGGTVPFRDGPPHVPNWHAFRMGIHERTGQVDGVARPEGLAPLTLGSGCRSISDHYRS